MAAESSVDASIENPVMVIQNNIMSTVYMLEYARNLKSLKRFIYFSTDEVFSVPDGKYAFKETDAHDPSNPYSASKSGSENICRSYHNTYGLPLLVVNIVNIFAERQFPDKFIPMCIKKILNREVIKIHCNSEGEVGYRYYQHARNVASAVLFLLENGIIGDSYNIGGEREVSNIEMAQLIAKIMKMELKYEMDTIVKERSGHDHGYRLDDSKIKALGWDYPINMMEGIERVVKWTLKHPEFLEE